MGLEINNTEHLKTQEGTLVKQWIVYDGVGRPSEIYTAETGAIDGKSCTKTEYEYVDATTSRVLKMKESNSNWDATWDI